MRSRLRWRSRTVSRRRSRAGRHPSRSQAGERVPDGGRPRQDSRLRPGAAAAQMPASTSLARPGANSAGRRPGDVRIHVPGAGQRRSRRRTHRYLRAGCVLYEMLTGRPLFAGATPQEIVAGLMHDRRGVIGARSRRPAGAAADRLARIERDAGAPFRSRRRIWRWRCAACSRGSPRRRHAASANARQIARGAALRQRRRRSGASST